mgnify:CR=1 FL=1
MDQLLIDKIKKDIDNEKKVKYTRFILVKERIEQSLYNYQHDVETVYSSVNVDTPRKLKNILK